MNPPIIEPAAIARVKASFGLDRPPAPLHPELVDHVQLKPIPTIHHPLMIWLGYDPVFNHMINESYTHKKALYAEKIAARDWKVIAYLVEKPYRMDKLVEHYSKIPEPDWWHVLASIWTSIENVWQYHPFLPMIFRGRDTAIREMHDDDEWAAYEALPSTIQVYRGCKWHNRNGWSWTLDRGKAEFFAKRFLKKRQRGRILTCTIEKERVLYYTDCRKEKECVIRCGRSGLPAGTKATYCD